MWLKSIFFTLFGYACAMSSSFDIGGVISGNRLAGVPLGGGLGAGELDVEGVCARAGAACLDCSLAVTCVALPVGWLKVPQESCGEGLTCNAHAGGCSARHVPECDAATHAYHHTCEQVGIFPDAHDCRKFHLCSPPEEVPSGRPADHRAALCPRHYGYNPQTAQCSIKLKNGQCSEKPVPPCTKVGQTGVLPASSNYYFVCLVKKGALHPQVFICPHGWSFLNGFCQPKEESEEKVSKDNVLREVTTTATTEKIETADVTSKIDSFFSTDKPTTFKPDTFLADKFDLANYETTDDAPDREVGNSFESNEFW